MSKTTIKYIARFLLEAETPLFVGSGNSSLLKDALVHKDANGFPMIPGTSLTGVLRHSFSKLQTGEKFTKIFGDSKGGETGTGSLVKISPALMMLDKQTVSEGLILDDKWETLKEQFDHLPVRQHVRITDKGIAEKNGLFDNEVVYKGTRFVFELELTDLANDFQTEWKKLLEIVQSPDFRIGAGIRNGYGSLRVLKILDKKFDLCKDLAEFLKFSPSFNATDWSRISDVIQPLDTPNTTKNHYQLVLTPDPFFMFGSGFGDDEVDNTPLEEEIIVYSDSGISFRKQTLIPSSSLKGAIAHRVAFHCNKKKLAEGKLPETGNNNEAVVALFGKAGKDISDPSAGKVFINDIFISSESVKNDKIFNHVAIDRFTGGAIEGALFSEKVSYLHDESVKIDVFVEKNIPDAHIAVLEETFKDICKGLLPLGGMTTKGHGIFTGTLIMNKKEIYSYL